MRRLLVTNDPARVTCKFCYTGLPVEGQQSAAFGDICVFAVVEMMYFRFTPYLMQLLSTIM